MNSESNIKLYVCRSGVKYSVYCPIDENIRVANFIQKYVNCFKDIAPEVSQRPLDCFGFVRLGFKHTKLKTFRMTFDDKCDKYISAKDRETVLTLKNDLIRQAIEEESLENI